MSFTGNPGTGKTTVARRMADVLHRLKYIRRNHVVTVSRDDLVGQYIGHTAPKTKEVLKKAMGGVLFIDEAYYLYRPENERDYGQEAIEILLQVMEDNRDDLVVIMAGYKDRIETFFKLEPGHGLAHRPPHRLPRLFGGRAVPDRRPHGPRHELRARRGRRDARCATISSCSMQQPRFSNARSIRNALDRTRLRMANRLFEAARPGPLSRADLVQTMTADDIKASRVFAQGQKIDVSQD